MERENKCKMRLKPLAVYTQAFLGENFIYIYEMLLSSRIRTIPYKTLKINSEAGVSGKHTLENELCTCS